MTMRQPMNQPKSSLEALLAVARGAALPVAAIALATACGSAPAHTAVATTGAHASAGEDTGYGYMFEADATKNAAGSSTADLSRPHAAGDRIPPETIQAVVRQHFAAFAACYENGLKTNPHLAGTVTVKFVAVEDGTTKEAANDGSTLPDAEVVSCVVGEFGKITYPAGGGILTVVYPLEFAP
jgi:Ca-activated chloride channel family protein